ILSSTGKVFTDGVGNVIRMSGTAQDVTEQKKYEEELKISEERFFKIFDSNPIPMTLSEIKTNKIKYANNLFYNAFGYTKEEVIGNSSEELNLMDPEESKRVIDLIFGYLHENRSLAEVQSLSKEETEALLLKLKQSEKMKDFEICYTRKNGETFPAIVSFELIRIGTESYTVTSYQDITERKKSETLLKNQNDQLEKMNKELESFAYVSSHDLQEPLRKIQTFASRITEKEENNLSDSGKDMFNRMQNAAKRMQTLIQDLLAYSRTNTTERKFEITDLNEIIAEVKEDLKEELQEKHAIIEANQLCDAKIIPFQFRQLLHNLIGNSLKFSNPNHPPLIQIKCEIAKGMKLNNEKLSPQNKYCHITVSDNGIGFEEQYNERIFEVFQRLHGKNEYNGTGIGLSIVKKIVENHHGIVTAKGKLNKGATFEIYIPAT
ncbi:MAG: PAS domain-containing sensor histidine kinase, partial [Chitinophagaceae bacterium]